MASVHTAPACPAVPSKTWAGFTGRLCCVVALPGAATAGVDAHVDSIALLQAGSGRDCGQELDLPLQVKGRCGQGLRGLSLLLRPEKQCQALHGLGDEVADLLVLGGEVASPPESPPSTAPSLAATGRRASCSKPAACA